MRAAMVYPRISTHVRLLCKRRSLELSVVICRPYCGHLWHDIGKSALRKVIVGYNRSFRFLMKYHRNCSASGMFVSNCVPSFKEMWRKYICFTQRLANSDNAIVAAIFSSCRLSSNFWRRWDSLLYTASEL